MENDRIERQYQDSKDLVAYLMEKVRCPLLHT